jgi:hypothetical protein
MKNKIIIELIVTLLVSLFVYASLSKLFAYNDFQAALLNQPIPQWTAKILVWLLPAAELAVVCLLFSSSTRLWGLYSSGLLMLIFTGYVGLILTNRFGRIPCSCGGILKNMGWGVHLVFNIFFLLIAITGIVLSKRRQTGQREFLSLVV